MKLLLVLLALAGRRLLPAELAQIPGRCSRQWRDLWLGRGSASAYLVLALVLLPPLLLLALLLWAVEGQWYQAPFFLISLLTLAWVMLDKQQPGTAARLQDEWLQKAWPTEPDLLSLSSTLGLELESGRRQLVKEQLAELFAPLFWFLLLGPLAVLTYYLLRILAELSAVQASGRLAADCLSWADWLPARVLALTLALAGRFQETWQFLRERLLDTKSSPLELLDGAAAAAHVPALDDNADAAPGALLVLGLADFGALFERALVVWIVLLALKTLWP